MFLQQALLKKITNIRNSLQPSFNLVLLFFNNLRAQGWEGDIMDEYNAAYHPVAGFKEDKNTNPRD